MATVIGIFEEQYKNNESLTVVKPGSQTRRFTHVNDTVKACYYAFKKKNAGITVLPTEKATQFWKLLKCLIIKSSIYQKDLGEICLCTNFHAYFHKVFKIYGKISLKSYIKSIVKSKKKS